MERTFYDDQCYSCTSTDSMSDSSPSPKGPSSGHVPTTPGSTTSSSSSDGHHRKRPAPSPVSSEAGSPSIKELKSSLKLDLNSPKEAPTKKQLLQTPDVIRNFILASPELEKFLTQGVTAAATPTPTKLLYPSHVTSAQRQYAQGFIDALNHVQQLNGFVPSNTNNLLSPGFLTPLAATVANELRRSPLAAQATTSAIVSAINAATAAVNSSLTSLPPSSVVLVQSPTRSTPTDPIQVASIMQTMSRDMNNFHQQHHSQGLMPPHVPYTIGATAFESHLTSLNGGAPATMANLPAAMASFNVKRETAVSTAAVTVIPHIVVDDRPPSQKDPTAYEFTSLNAAPTVTSVDQSFVEMSPHPFETSTVRPSNPVVSRPTVLATRPSVVPARRPCREDADHLVPNVTMPPPSSTTAEYSGGGGGHQPFDMDAQERMKLERKRARNRQAATKCRMRKMERIEELTGFVDEEKKRGDDLKTAADALRKDMDALQQALQMHRSRGCSLDKSS